MRGDIPSIDSSATPSALIPLTTSPRYKELSKDRFASHVVQTILILGGGETVEREVWKE